MAGAVGGNVRIRNFANAIPSYTMKYLTFFLFTIAVFRIQDASAQTLDEIINRHIEAVGGMTAWNKVNSIVYKGSLDISGTVLQTSRSILKDKGMREDMIANGNNGYTIFTQDKGWTYFPGSTSQPREINSVELQKNKGVMDVTDQLLSYKMNSGKADLAGKEKIGERDAYRINYVDRYGKKTALFVDTKSYLIVRQIATDEFNGWSEDIETDFSNFKKLPEGITVPMTLTLPNYIFKFTSVEVNSIQDESIFRINAD